MEPKAVDLLAAGDRDGQMTWMRVMNAVDELLARERIEGATLH
jgi:hypothetical protein